MSQTIELGTSTIQAVRNIIGDPWWPIIISSFCGAFFAFIFIKIEDYLSRISKRKRQNYNALVLLEYMGNENLSIAHDDIFVADDMINSATLTQSTSVPHINFNNFYDLIIRSELLSELMNIDFINECMFLNIHARKINSSLAAIMKSYDQMNGGIFANTIQFPVYLQNVSDFANRLGQMKKVIEGFLDDDMKMIATARVLKRYETPSFTKFLFRFLRNKNKPLAELKEEIETEKKRLADEIETTAKKGKERIDELLKKPLDQN
jgi:hypothetical protein